MSELNKSFIFIKIELDWDKMNKTEDGRAIEDYGMKFHVSLNEEKREDFNRGWDIVCTACMREELNFKVIYPRLKMSDVPEQKGKDVSIYIELRPDKYLSDWKNLAKEISEKLHIAGISPGFRPEDTVKKGKIIKKEHLIPGTPYVSYRYEYKEPDDENWNQKVKEQLFVKLAGEPLKYLEDSRTEGQPSTSTSPRL